MTECGQRIKNTALLRTAFFEPVSDLRRSPQFAKAEKKENWRGSSKISIQRAKKKKVCQIIYLQLRFPLFNFFFQLLCITMSGSSI